ncbi:unnamed protein product [Effrenium voratum]|nr:unnamed protein product [Effrenium voratum]
MAETEAATEEPEASKEAYQVSRDVAGTLRRQDPVTGDVELYTSIDGILQAVPKMNWDMAATWSRLPIMRVHLFLDKVSFQRGGIMRSYASKVFSPEGLDLIQAIAWWRKRVKSPAKGFAVFEASFDSQVCITDPPTLMLDGATGEAEADDAEAIQRKRESHAKRRELDKRWVTKGISEEALQKIKQADMHRMSRKVSSWSAWRSWDKMQRLFFESCARCMEWPKLADGTGGPFGGEGSSWMLQGPTKGPGGIECLK